MKNHITLILLIVLITGCTAQPATVPVTPSTSTPLGQMETNVAVTIYANGTSTAAAEVANQSSTAAANLSPFIVARTADAMTAAVRTPIPTSSAKKYNVSVPASLQGNLRTHWPKPYTTWSNLE